MVNNAVRGKVTSPPPKQSPVGFTPTGAWALATMTGVLGYWVSLQLNPPPAKAVAAGSSPASVPSAYGTSDDLQKCLEELRAAFPSEQVSTNPNVIHEHGYSTNAHHPAADPSVVVYAHNTEDVVKVVNLSRKYRIPISPYSGGTSLEGNYGSINYAGISLDLSAMDKVLEIHEKDGDMVVQAGCRWDDLNDLLKDKGIPLFFPLDAGPGATIGGMIATGCSGTNAVRYGTAKAEWFLNATVVLPSGEVIKTRRRARKSSAGFDTTKLFIGAEGTLGIVTEATIRLAPRLPTSVSVAQFPNVELATEAVTEILNKGVPIQCVELCDDKQMEAINRGGFAGRSYPEVDSIFFKFQGTPASIKEASSITQKICKAHGSTGFISAKNEHEADDLWHARKTALWSNLAMVPGSRAWSTDVCVPMSRLPQLVQETKEDLAQHGIVGMVVGHVGDGNFHTSLLFKNEEELDKCKEAVHRMVERALALDGTCTGEHGVGIGKREYLYEELGPGTVELMKTIKNTLDPYNLFNPGKLYPDEQPASEKH
ncbi:hypothetical protein DACRYDRAFT_24534 [Dacryopinax primogenitus]|uniref:D-lactate dehydrogenase (cytochrome) n=1 Tax=Dacryopinax primogenitus (strain DJM 731) TaxID=1858805 RepID=M5FY70_DACPD|nr:uncharacterized protein DACRYDRAFT_24534 [Dacryopinax primogenitus]EJT98506.1 hypothetical protein DACRYDRAFT_24534 [Dacryopinax primogenitus]